MASETILIIGACTLLLGGFAANEMTHGGLAEGMGLGHRHMFDTGGYHCSGDYTNETWDQHVEHMHGGDPTVRHDQVCGDGHWNEWHQDGPHMRR